MSEKKVPWLIKIQQESWQAEIILSGLIIFALTQAPKFIGKLFYVLGTRYIAFNDLDMFEDFLVTGVYWLIAGFIVHLVLRGIWAGFVGLSYTFPEGIRKDRMQFAPKFQRIIDRMPSPEQSIISLEKYCSVLFSVAFMLFMIILGLSSFNLIFNYFYAWFFISLGIFDTVAGKIINAISALFFLLYLVDFITAGLIKKIKWLSPFYYPIYWVLSMATFSFLYRNIYYTFISNFGRTKVILAILGYVVVTFFIFQQVRRGGSPHLDYFDYDATNLSLAQNYTNLRPEDELIGNASIQSDIIDDEVVRLFVVYRIHVDDLLDDCLTEEELEAGQGLSDKKLACLSNFYIVTLDGEQLTDLDWRFHIHEPTSENGILSYIDISKLPKGTHDLEIRYRKAPPFRRDPYIYANISFYKK